LITAEAALLIDAQRSSYTVSLEPLAYAREVVRVYEGGGITLHHAVVEIDGDDVVVFLVVR